MIRYDELKYVMQQLPVPSGWRAGKPMQLRGWQDKILMDCFGTEHRYEIIYIEIPRKNGKTTFTAALLAALFIGDEEPGAEFYCASGDKEQAGIIFTIGRSMIERTPALLKRIRVIPSMKKFVSLDDPTRFFRSLSADAHSKHGYNPYITVFDELHIFKNRDLWDVMDSGDVARESPMKIIITTAGNDMSTLCGEMHEHAVSVRDGKVIDPTFKGYIYTVTKRENWKDEAEWVEANPSLGSILDIARLRTKFTRAVGKPVAEAAFKRLHLNIWQESEYQWIDIDAFDACRIESVSPAMVQRGTGGLDLGFGQDATSLAIYKKVGDKSFFKTFVWITDDEAQRVEKMHGTPWTRWIREGYVRRYGKDIADYDVLERDVLEIFKQHGVKECGFDRWKSHHLITKLGRRCEMIPVGQGFASMTMPVKHVEGLVAARKLVHDGNPAVREAFKKVYIKQDAAGNAKPDKQKSWHKIDAVTSLLTAVAVAETRGEKKSVYESRGLA